jgi:hypothetical protein
LLNYQINFVTKPILKSSVGKTINEKIDKNV